MVRSRLGWATRVIGLVAREFRRDFEQVTNLWVIWDFMIRQAAVIRVIQQVFIIVFIQFFIVIVIDLAFVISDCSPQSAQAQ